MAETVTFSAKRFVLLGLAEKAGRSVVAARSTQPILRNFRVKAVAGAIEFTGTDLETTVRVHSPSVACDGELTALFPAARFTALLREAPETDVKVSVTGLRATVKAGPASWTLQLMDGKDFPVQPDLSGEKFQQVDRAKFLAAVRAVRYAVSSDGARANMMLVNIENGQVTGCDGSRFQRVKLDFPLDIQIPAAGSPAAVDQLTRLLGASDMEHMSVAETEHSLVFAVGSAVFSVQKFMARFADVERLLLQPAMENKLELTVSKKDLLDAIRRVRVNADSGTYAIGLRLTKGFLTVEARDSDQNIAEEVVEAVWDQPDRVVAVNHKFFAEMVAVHPAETCVFRLGKDSPRRRTMLMLRDEKSGATGVVHQMLPSVLG